MLEKRSSILTSLIELVTRYYDVIILSLYQWVVLILMSINVSPFVSCITQALLESYQVKIHERADRDHPAQRRFAKSRTGACGTLAPLMRSRHPIYRLYLYISRYTCTCFNTSTERPREHLLRNCCAYQLVIALTPPFISTDYYRVYCTRLFIDLLLNLLLLFNIHIDS